MNIDAKQIIKKFKSTIKYDEEEHCELLINVMKDKEKGRISAFVFEACISETKFWEWVRDNPLFREVYSYCKIIARELWEIEGMRLKNESLPVGQISNAFEHWKLIGWSRFGISKNSRIKLNLNPNDTPEKHYSQLLMQAAEGDFTASEIKQLMEAVNVGLNTHQVFTLQKQIDELNSNFAKLEANKDAHNISTNKGIAKKD